MGREDLSPTPAPGVQNHLADILESPAFRASPKSQQFLQYVVSESVAGRADSLKERVIGEQVFGRPADYDTGQDSIVRVKANDVRRRLSQYYEQHPGSALRIEMVSGSYGVKVRTAGPQPSEAPARPRKKWWLAGGAALAAAAITAFAFKPNPPATALFEEFWRPFLTASKPLLICMPAPEAFRIYGRDKDRLVAAFRPRAPGTPAPAVSRVWQDVRIVPEPGLLVGIGDAKAMSMLEAFAFLRHKEVQIRVSAMTSYADLKSSPSVVIGGETNQWTADLAQRTRFVLTKDRGRSVIWDHQTSEAVCTKPQSWQPPATRDCAVVTRLRSLASGNPMLLAAGLDHHGTYALGDFLTNPRSLQQVLEDAPKGWESRNLQIVFEVERLGDGTGAPQIRAVHSW